MKILTYVKSGILLLMIALSSPLLAGQKAELACVSSKQETFKGQATFTCDTYELRVNISSDKDAGQMGAYGIYAISDKGSRMAYWTEDNGWLPYTEADLIKPVNIFLRGIEASKEFVVYKGSLDGLCKLSSGNSFNLYAWRATISPSRLKSVKSFIKRFEITGNQARNLFNAILLREADVRKTDGMVLTHTCPS